MIDGGFNTMRRFCFAMGVGVEERWSMGVGFRYLRVVLVQEIRHSQSCGGAALRVNEGCP